jgi:acetyltransferase-like isoleucine patch superfamily enzyme
MAVDCDQGILVSMIFFGVRSPLIVDYEITAVRLGLKIGYAVSVNGHPRLLSDIEVVALDDLGDRVRGPAMPCAFSPIRREALATLATKMGFDLADALVDPTAIVPPKLRIGPASFINAGVVMGGGCRFGAGVLINRSASIGHHTVLDDWVSIGPGAILSGNVRIGAHSMIGAGAILQSNIRLGANVRVAAGSVVRKDVEDNSIVSGNPGKAMRMRAVPSTLDLEDAE